MENELLKAEAPTPDLQLVVHNRETNKYYIPLVHDGVEIEWTRKGAPGKLTFRVQKDEILDMPEGSTVQLGYKKTNFFYGYVFEKKRNKDGTISVTAYDQLRYLKNKDIYSFVNVKAGDAIKAMAEDFQLTVGDLADTGYTIPKYHGSNETLLDIVQTLLDMTTENTKKIYVLYDDFGKLTLKEMGDMKVDILIDAETAENFEYTSTIDKDTYNRVKLYYDNDETGKRDVWMELDSANMKRWGVLQLTESVNGKKPLNFPEMAGAKLKLHNRPGRTLTIQNALGDVRIRAGCLLFVDLKLDDMKLTKRMIVETVKHKISNNLHTMDLTVRGDVITG